MVDREAKGSEPAGRCDAFHGVARGFPGATFALQRAGRRCDRHPHRQPQQGGDRGANRLLRQHLGHAHRPLWGPELQGCTRSGKGGGARGLRQPGSPFREAGGGVAADAGPGPVAAVSGGVRPTERPESTAAVGRPDHGPHRCRQANRDVRSDTVHLGEARWVEGSARIQHRPVRRCQHRQDARQFPYPARRRRGRPRTAHLRIGVVD